MQTHQPIWEKLSLKLFVSIKTAPIFLTRWALFLSISPDRLDNLFEAALVYPYVCAF